MCMTHLDEQELAQYVDALISDKQDHLPEEILEHVEECLECKLEVMEVWILIEPDDQTPTFDIPLKQ